MAGQCEYCGSPLRDGASKCDACGAKVGERRPLIPQQDAAPTRPMGQRPVSQRPMGQPPAQQQPARQQPAPTQPRQQPAPTQPRQQPMGQRPVSQPPAQQPPAPTQPRQQPTVQLPRQQPAPTQPRQQPPAQPPRQPQPAPPTPQPKRRAIPLAAIAGIVGALVVVLIAVIFFVRGNSANKRSTAVAQGESWTVLMYFCGSNLETKWGLATTNIAELASVDMPDNVNLVLETGGATSWRHQAVDATYLQRFEMHDGELVLQDQLPRTSMGAEETFTDFITWGVETYPADHYMLIFWDHGGGSLGGVCQDEMDYDCLKLPEMAAGFEAAGVTFDVVGFDTCLQATLEQAQILAPYANCMVASEATEPGSGWAWNVWPQWFANPGPDVFDLGRVICDSYYDKCASENNADTATLSTVDLTRLDELTRAFNDVSVELAHATEDPQRLQPIVNKGRDVQSFGYASYEEGYTDMVDLGDLMDCIDEPLGSSDDAVREALANVVVYERHGELVPGSTGLSVFYPLKIDYDTFEEYSDLSLSCKLDNVPYLQFLAARTGAYDLVNWNGMGIIDLDPIISQDALGQISCEAQINSAGQYQVDITSGSEWVTVATYELGMLLDDGSVAWLGSDNDLDLAIDESTAHVTYTEHFAGGWYKIGDAFVYAQIVDMVWGDDSPAYNLYSTPVEWTYTNSQGERETQEVNLLTRYNYATNDYDVVCLYKDIDSSGMSGKLTGALSEGDELRFLVQRNVNGEMQSGSTGTITWTNDTQMTMARLADARYLYYVKVTDIFGNDITLEPAVIEYRGGERTAQMLSAYNEGVQTGQSGQTEGGDTAPAPAPSIDTTGMQRIGNDLVGSLYVPESWENRSGDYPTELTDRYGLTFFVDPETAYSSATFGAQGYLCSVRMRGYEAPLEESAQELVDSYRELDSFGEVDMEETTFHDRPARLITTSVPADGLYIVIILVDRDGDGANTISLEAQGDASHIEQSLSYLSSWEI